eukprot:5184969-Alexandrium_andersonii.AAC.1
MVRPVAFALLRVMAAAGCIQHLLDSAVPGHSERVDDARYESVISYSVLSARVGGCRTYSLKWPGRVLSPCRERECRPR